MFCAIAALAFLHRLPPSIEAKTNGATAQVTGLSDIKATIRWLVSRQTSTITDDDDFDTNGDETDTSTTCHDAHSFIHPNNFPSSQGKISYDERPTRDFQLMWTGVNGRCNKIADTCYAFWVGGALSVRHPIHSPFLESKFKKSKISTITRGSTIADIDGKIDLRKTPPPLTRFNQTLAPGTNRTSGSRRLWQTGRRSTGSVSQLPRSCHAQSDG